tara:strand:- start:405 stop:833 length:429 start_codon:yes stop_codon:yes gene_type:complete
MAQQMRKFEQEAIAKEILDTINASSSKEQQAMEKSSKELKNIHKLQSKIQSIQEEERILYRERRNITEQMETAIQDFNNFCLDDNALYKVHKDYNDNISWSCNEWEIRQNIENKLAIALLSSDWQERLPEIIKTIASQFTTK